MHFALFVLDWLRGHPLPPFLTRASPLAAGSNLPMADHCEPCAIWQIAHDHRPLGLKPQCLPMNDLRVDSMFYG